MLAKLGSTAIAVARQLTFEDDQGRFWRLQIEPRWEPAPRQYANGERVELLPWRGSDRPGRRYGTVISVQLRGSYVVRRDDGATINLDADEMAPETDAAQGAP